MASFATISLACRVIFGPCSFLRQQTNKSLPSKKLIVQHHGEDLQVSSTMIQGERQKKKVVSGHQMPSVDLKGGLMPL